MKLKQLKIFALCLFMSSTSLIAADDEKPEKVYSIAKVMMPIEWYKDQKKLWKNILDENNSNQEAWYNYYMAQRAIYNLDGRQESDFEELSAISKECYKAYPNSFMGNFLTFLASNDMSDNTHLLKAYEINPDDPRTYDNLMIDGETSLDMDKRKEFAIKYYESKDLHPGIVNWGYNMLMGIEDDAILFTNGDNDTYAVWVNQDVKGVKPKVQVLNTSLLMLDDYRKGIFDRLNIPNSLDLSKAKNSNEMIQMLIAHIIANTDRPIHLQTYTHDSQIEPFKDKLYLTGLTYKYCENDFDNLSIIKRNFEKRYLCDYLVESFYSDIMQNTVDRANTSYIPSFLKLYKHYKDSENTIQANKLKAILIRISERAGMESEILGHISNNTPSEDNSFKYEAIDVKQLDKNFVELAPKLYINIAELSNLEYKIFLNNLKRSGSHTLLETCLYDSSLWNTVFPQASNDPMKNTYHNHPAYDNYPCVNISHEAAKEYCKWLTVQYNQQRKRKYTQVKFRLPTEEEWEKAARSNKSSGDMPFGDNAKNEKGCYLANFNPDGDYIADGGFYTVNCLSYIPNELGLYNTLGNVAEMINVKGKTKGGSWYDPLDKCKIDTHVTYEKADPRVGFRLVMEVIEK